jgi:CHAT domain-containing protein/tetratricopeptide (TPR) repeat protein
MTARAAFRWLRNHSMAAVMAVGLLAAGAAGRADEARLNQAMQAFMAGNHAAATGLLEAELTESERARGEDDPASLLLMSALGISYGASGRAADSLRMAERVLQLRTQALGEAHADTLVAMAQLARALQAQGRPAEALERLERLLALRRKTQGERHPDTQGAMNNLAVAYGVAGRHAHALALLEPLLEASRGTFGESDARRVTLLRNLASTYAALGRPAEAQPLREELVAALRQRSGDRHPDTWMAMSEMAEGLRGLGRLGEALAWNLKVLDAVTAQRGPRHRDTLMAMNNLAATQRDLGQHAAALALLEKALAAFGPEGAELDADRLMLMNNLAAIALTLGRGDRALALGEKVLAESTRTLGESHAVTLLATNNLAETLRALGRGAEALPLLDALVAQRHARLGEAHPDTLAATSNLASVYQELGRHDQALALGQTLVERMAVRLGARHPQTLTAMNNLGAALRGLGRDTEAETLQRQVLDGSTATLGGSHPDSVRAMSNLAATQQALGRHGAARSLLEQAWQISRRSAGEQHPQTQAVTGQLVLAELAAGRHAQAVALNEKLLVGLTQVLGARHPQTLRAMETLAVAHLANGQVRPAAALSPRYVAGAEWQRAQAGLATGNRQSVFAGYAEGYRLFSLAHGALGQAAEGFRLAEGGKARTLLEGMALQHAMHSGVLPLGDREALASLARQSTALDNLITQASGADARRSLEAQRNDLARRLEALHAELSQRHPRFARLADPHVLGSTDLPGLLPAATLALSYVVAPGGFSGVWLVDAAGQPRFQGLRRMPHLADAVEAFRQGSAEAGHLADVLRRQDLAAWRLADGDIRLLPSTEPAPAGAAPVADVHEIGEWLSRHLLQPLARDLAATPNWIISPDGALAQLPFDALVLGGRRVSDGHQLQLVQSLSTYALGRVRQREYAALPRTRDLLAVGNPAYAKPASPPAPRGAQRAQFGVRQQLQLAHIRDLWDPLPGTEAEVIALRRIFPSSDGLLGAQASEARLLALNARGELKNYRVLHFATHAFFAADNPALSSVVLSQVDLEPGTNGFITAAKWPAYDLRSDLTVLSGCETGLGRNLSGEGVMGLPYALFVAGNVNTVVSLWPVDDEGTAAFMQAFYTRLAGGLAAAPALARTKREFAGHARFSHPRYWSGFILVGAG